MPLYKAQEGIRGCARTESSNAASTSVRIGCGTCGTHAYPDDKYCVFCGGRLIRQCGRCGALINHPVAHYCAQCGISLRQKAS